MKRLLNMDIKTVAIIVLCVFLLLRNCTNGDTTTGEIVKVDGKKYELVEQKIDTVFIEKTVKVPTYVPKYITKEVIKEVQIPADIDSLAVIKDYYSKVTVRDTLQLNYDFPEEVKDSLGNKPPSNLGYGILTDVIGQNSIQSRDVDWYFKIPTVYNTKVVKDLPKTQLYYGFNLGLNRTDIFSSVGGGLILKTKKDKLYQLNIGLMNQPTPTSSLTPYIGGGIYWKINLKKK